MFTHTPQWQVTVAKKGRVQAVVAVAVAVASAEDLTEGRLGPEACISEVGGFPRR